MVELVPVEAVISPENAVGVAVEPNVPPLRTMGVVMVTAPTLKTKVPPELMVAVPAPAEATVVARAMPASTDRPPLKVFAPERTSVPVPDL